MRATRSRSARNARRNNWLTGGLVLLLLLAGAPDGRAQQIEPRAFSNSPVGINFLVGGYNYADGGVSADPTVPLENAKIRSDGIGLGFSRTLSVWGRSSRVAVAGQYADLSGSADFQGEPRSRDVRGWTDPTFQFAINFYGAPALNLQDFARYKQDLIIGASLTVTPPWGQYAADKLLNNGTNRWSVRPQVGLSKALGHWTLELATAVTLISDNDEFLGSRKLEQDPIYSVQGHVIYGFPSGIWLALDGTWYRGGRTTLDGVLGNNLEDNSRLGATLAVPVNRWHSIKLSGSSGVSTRTGSDFDLFAIAWQYRWGGGF